LEVWLFLLVQIVFDLPPLQNALTVIPCGILFFITSGAMKTAPGSIYDAIYGSMSIVVGLLISHHRTRLAIDNFIAKKCLTQANFALYHTCTTDELTGLSNRRMIFERFDKILKDCVASGQSLACIVMDIDDYKQYNDTYGHPEGDVLLRRIGGILRTYAEKQKIDIGRIGGEEFLAVWATGSSGDCERVAEELRSMIAGMETPHESMPGFPNVTISAGLCILPPVLAHRAYFFADKALYRAKDTGKNRCCRYDVETGEYRLINCKTNGRIAENRTVDRLHNKA
jgi:diguanylate cyclase (GGDEF)-like protein